MREPKELCDYSFDELVDVLTFEAIQSVVNGRMDVRGSIYTACDSAIRWRREKQEKENKENESKKT